jgi:hypothetical protein
MGHGFGTCGVCDNSNQWLWLCRMWIDCCFSHCPTKGHYEFWKVRDQKEMLTEFWYDCMVCCWEIETKRKCVCWLDNSPQGTVFIQNNCISGLCPPSRILNARKHNVSKLDLFPSSVEGRKHLLCWVPWKELTSITRQAQKSSNSECHTPSSESFRVYQQFSCLPSSL